MNDFQQIFLENPAMLLVCDASGCIREINHRCVEETGYSREEVLGSRIADVIDGGVFAEDPLWWYRYLWDQGRVSDAEYRLVRKDGRVLDVLLDGAVMQTRAGEKSFLAAIRNVSDLKRIHARLYLAMEAAGQEDKVKSEVLSRMRHDLRTPLNAILGFGQLLEMSRKPPLSADQQELTEEILTAGRHLLELLDEFSDGARIEADKLRLSMERVDLSMVMKESLASVLPMAAQQGIEIRDGTLSQRRTQVLADEGRLKQVLSSLLSNAVKYNREGGRVDAAVESVNDAFVRLTVCDTGPGIPEGKLNSLFQPLSRLEQVPGVEGTGIGLTIAKNLIELMGGRIGLESRPGEGSCFWIELRGAD